MKKLIRLDIEIENEMFIGMRGKFEVTNCIFTEYETLFDAQETESRVKEAIKMLKGWTRITATTTVKDDNDFSPVNANQIISSFRYLNKSGDIERANLNKVSNSYSFHPETDKKRIFEDLKYLINSTNTKFIELVRETAKA